MASINTLISILSYAIALCGMLPLFPWLENVPRLIVVAGLAAGIWQAVRGPWLLKNWIFNVAIVPVFLYYALQFSRTNPVQPVVSVLAIMLATRLAGPKNTRHYLQISTLSLFCLASSSLFDLSPRFLLYLGLILLLVAVSLVLLTFYDQDSAMSLAHSDLRKVLAAGLLMPLVSLPLLIFFFPLLPRTQLPLWNFLAAPASRTSGFSDQVEPGISSQAGTSRVLAFRAEMQPLAQQQLYWRGTVFNRVEGRRWVRVAAPSENINYTGRRISQTIYPEPGSSRILLALDAPASLTLQRSRRLPDGVYEYQGSLGKRLVYTAESISTGTQATSTDIKRSFYLTLPDNLPERIQRLADNIQSRGRNDASRLELLEAFFRNNGFRYSKSGLPTGENALEQFVFESKQGHCEFFASSFALTLRAAGVPARLVGGYLGGEYNQMGGYYQVSEEMAHVWVEVYITGQGWLRVDPSSFAENAGSVWSAPRVSFLSKVRMALDSLYHTWNRAVITYDFERQVDAARKVGARMQTVVVVRMLKVFLPYLAAVIGLVGVGSIVLYRKRIFLSREDRLLRCFYQRVRQDCGVAVERGRVGLFEIAVQTDNPAVREFADIYAGAVYRDRRPTDDEYRRLRKIVKEGFV
jgi:transglutaminase-like putative cysteine protease